ncbi:MAG: Gfo/Idh/MocA family oxidoreductase [Opitutales bacterium]|nr:Gfo/Idh/MocA family oxidoreductase [Opitutales bacterium]
MSNAMVIGAGMIARQHIAAIQASGGATCAAVCDLSPGLAACAAEQYGIERWDTDYRKLLKEIRPDVVHVATPAHSHLSIARDALDAGAHVLVEKPITESWDQWVELREHARQCGRWVLEDHDYQYNRPTQRILAAIGDGSFGEVTHVDAFYCVNIHGNGSAFADPNLAHPTLALPGGAIHDFLPHLAYLVTLFVGPMRSVQTIWQKREPHSVLPHDEFRAIIEANRSTATIGFSSHTSPPGYWLTVYGTRAMARVNYFEHRLTFAQGGQTLRKRLTEGAYIWQAAATNLQAKLSGGPDVYEGLHELVKRLYEALSTDGEPR